MVQYEAGFVWDDLRSFVQRQGVGFDDFWSFFQGVVCFDFVSWVGLSIRVFWLGGWLSVGIDFEVFLKEKFREEIGELGDLLN